MNDAERQERHNQEVAARESGRNDSGTQAGSHGASQHNSSNATSTGSSCFPSYTQILTPIGWQDITQLNTGDDVMSLNRQGEIQKRRILRVKEYQPNQIVTVHTDGDSFDTTRSHSIMTQRGWVTVAQLQAGDVITQMNQRQQFETQVISAVENNGKTEPVFNLIVQGNYTFIVKGCVAHSFTYFKVFRMITHEVLAVCMQITNLTKDVVKITTG